MSDNLPISRENLPPRPVPRPAPFWESKEAKRVRETENRRLLAVYDAQLHALVTEAKQENRKKAAFKTLHDANDLLHEAYQVTDPSDPFQSRMNAEIVQAFKDAETRRF